jgi:hypothetical protein
LNIQPPIEEDVTQYPEKVLTEALIQKGVTLKGKDKVPLSKITLLSLEEREITVLSEL